MERQEFRIRLKAMVERWLDASPDGIARLVYGSEYGIGNSIGGQVSAVKRSLKSMGLTIIKKEDTSRNQLRTRLQELHQQEDGMNREMGNIDKQIKELQRQKDKLSKRISGNMRYRNRLIDQL